MDDLSSLRVVERAEAGFWVRLDHPDGVSGPTTIEWKMMGFDAEPVVKAARQFDRDEAKRVIDAKGEEDFDLAPSRERRDIALCKAAAMDWRGQVIGKKKVVFTKEKASEILEDPNFIWLVAQLVAKAKGRAVLFPKPSGK